MFKTFVLLLETLIVTYSIYPGISSLWNIMLASLILILKICNTPTLLVAVCGSDTQNIMPYLKVYFYYHSRILSSRSVLCAIQNTTMLKILKNASLVQISFSHSFHSFIIQLYSYIPYSFLDKKSPSK